MSDRSLRFLCGADLNSLKPPSPRHRSLGGLLPPSSNKSSSPTSHIMPFSISQWVGINHLTQPQTTVSPHYHRLADGLTRYHEISLYDQVVSSSNLKPVVCTFAWSNFVCTHPPARQTEAFQRWLRKRKIYMLCFLC